MLYQRLCTFFDIHLHIYFTDVKNNIRLCLKTISTSWYNVKKKKLRWMKCRQVVTNYQMNSGNKLKGSSHRTQPVVLRNEATARCSMQCCGLHVVAPLGVICLSDTAFGKQCIPAFVNGAMTGHLFWFFRRFKSNLILKT